MKLANKQEHYSAFFALLFQEGGNFDSCNYLFDRMMENGAERKYLAISMKIASMFLSSLTHTKKSFILAFSGTNLVLFRGKRNLIVYLYALHIHTRVVLNSYEAE